MATEIKSLLGYTLLKANKKVDLDDEQHEASIGRGDIFGVTQYKNNFFVLDIDLKPLALHSYRVTKAEYLKIAASGTLVVSGLEKFLGKANVRKLYKPTGDVDVDFRPLGIQRALDKTFKSVLGVGFDEREVYGESQAKAKNLEANLKVAPIYPIGNTTIKEAVANFKKGYLKEVFSSNRTIEIKPKILKKDSNVIAVTGDCVLYIPKGGVAKEAQAPDKDTLLQHSSISESIYFAGLEPRCNLSYAGKNHFKFEANKGALTTRDAIALLHELAISGAIIKVLPNSQLQLDLYKIGSATIDVSPVKSKTLTENKSRFNLPEVIMDKVFKSPELKLLSFKPDYMEIDAGGNTSAFIDSLVHEDDDFDPSFEFDAAGESYTESRTGTLSLQYSDFHAYADIKVKFTNLEGPGFYEIDDTEEDDHVEYVDSPSPVEVTLNETMNATELSIHKSLQNALEYSGNTSNYTVSILRGSGAPMCKLVDSGKGTLSKLGEVLTELIYHGHTVNVPNGGVSDEGTLEVEHLTTGVKYTLHVPASEKDLLSIGKSYSYNQVIFDDVFPYTDYTLIPTALNSRMKIDVKGATQAMVSDAINMDHGNEVHDIDASLEFTNSSLGANQVIAKLSYLPPEDMDDVTFEILITNIADGPVERLKAEQSGKNDGDVTPYNYVKPILERMRELFNGYNARVDVESHDSTEPNKYEVTIVTGASDRHKFEDGAPLMEAVLQISKEFKEYLDLSSHSFIGIVTSVRYAENTDVTTFYTGNSYN